MKVKIFPSKVSGSLAVPPSKSLAHRALICASLAQGCSHLSGFRSSKDMEATIGCMQALGAQISVRNDQVEITGCSPAGRQKPVCLDAYESGSTLRFILPIAALSSAPAVFTGQGKLLSRPMGVYADLFVSQNLLFEQSATEIKVQGPLSGGLFEIPGDISSQFISGLLFAAPLMSESSEIAVLPPYESRSYVDLTLEMERRFGINIQTPSSHGYIIPAGQQYQSCDLAIEGDYSQAAFFAVLAALNGPLVIENLNPDSLQGDKAILSFLQRAGAGVSFDQDSLQVSPGRRLPFSVSLADCPDLGPILCVLAAYIPGTSVLKDAARLRMKESDRIAAMEEELRKWGVQISSDENTITITGKETYQQAEPVLIDSHNDHRIAMAMSIFGLCARSASVIENAQAVEKSYPDFFEDLKKIKGVVS